MQRQNCTRCTTAQLELSTEATTTTTTTTKSGDTTATGDVIGADRFIISHRQATVELLDIFRTAIGQTDADVNTEILHIFDVTDTRATPASVLSETAPDCTDVLSIGALMLVCLAGRRGTATEEPIETTTTGTITAANINAELRHLRSTLRFAGGALRAAFALHAERARRVQCQNLLNISQRLLSNIGDLGQLLRSVMVEAKNMTAAERCSLFLLDEYSGELVSKVFDGDEATREIRIAAGQGIAGHVAQTGRLLNIRDAYAHPLFYKGVDELTGFKTRNLLCFPICNEERVIGVAQLCNKVSSC